MEAKNMVGPEAKQGVFGISAPPREKPRVVKPDVKPASVSPPSDKQPPKTKKPWIQRLIGNLGVRIGLGVLAVGGAGYVARETISNNIPSLSRPAEKPASFDNAPDKGTLNIDNTVFITDLNSLRNTITPLPDSTPKHDIYIVYPIVGLPTSGSVTYEKDLLGKNPAAPIFSENTRQEAIDNNIRNIFNTPILKDQELILPVDPAIKAVKIAVVRRLERSLPEGVFETVKISYTDPRNGKYYQIGIAEDISTPFNSLIEGDIKPYGSIGQAESIEKTIQIENGQPIKILRSLQNGTLNVTAMAKSSESAPGSQFYPVNLNLFATKDTATNKTGVAVVVEK